MIRERIQLTSFEAQRDVTKIPCELEIFGNHGKKVAIEELCSLVTDAYLITKQGCVPRLGFVKKLLTDSNKDNWELDRFTIRPSSDSGELVLKFTRHGCDDIFVVNLWASGVKPGFTLVVSVPSVQDILRQDSILCERFVFVAEEHDGRTSLTMYRNGKSDVAYYPVYIKHCQSDERYVVKEITGTLSACTTLLR